MKKIISLTLSISLLFLATFAIFEPEITSAAATSDSALVTLTVSAGEISITTPDDVSFGTLSGFTGGTATNSLTWNVKTNNDTGYNFGLKATTAPALGTGTYTIADYTPVGGTTTPDYAWSIASATSEFGFAPYNASNSVAKFKSATSICNTGSTVTAWTCWYGLATADVQTANRSTKTTTAGEDNIIYLEVQINADNGTQEDGSYTATLTATATTN
jgi:hypothetical protein